MVPSTAYFGTKQTNPFYFYHYNLERFQLAANDKLFPSIPLEMDFERKDVLDAYNQLFEGLAGAANICTITFDQFLNGYTIILCDLTPDSSGSAGKREFKDFNLLNVLIFQGIVNPLSKALCLLN